jgi:hypothetical protein
MNQPANDNPNLALSAAILNEEAARQAVDGRIAIYRSVVGNCAAGPKSTEATMARQDVQEAVNIFLNQIEITHMARLNLMFGGGK